MTEFETIGIKGFEFRYNNGRYFIDGLCWERKDNLSFWKSGKGKTTLLKIMLGRLVTNSPIVLNNNELSPKKMSRLNSLFASGTKIGRDDNNNFDLFSDGIIKNKICLEVYNSIIEKLAKAENTLVTSDVIGLNSVGTA